MTVPQTGGLFFIPRLRHDPPLAPRACFSSTAVLRVRNPQPNANIFCHTVQNRGSAETASCIVCSKTNKLEVQRMQAKRSIAISTTVLALTCLSAAAQTAITYQKPPAAIERLAQRSAHTHRAYFTRPLHSPHRAVRDLPHHRRRRRTPLPWLAGLRFNPATNGPSRGQYSVSLALQPVSGGTAVPVTGVPAKLKASDATWSPDSRHLAFVQRNDKTATTAAGLQLWIVDVATHAAHPIAGLRLNAVLGRTPCEWMPDSAALLCKIVPTGRGPAPKVSDTLPPARMFLENLGKVTPGPHLRGHAPDPRRRKHLREVPTPPRSSPSCPLTGWASRTTLPAKWSPRPPSLLRNRRPLAYALVSALHRPFSYTVPSERFNHHRNQGYPQDRRQPKRMA